MAILAPASAPRAVVMGNLERLGAAELLTETIAPLTWDIAEAHHVDPVGVLALIIQETSWGRVGPQLSSGALDRLALLVLAQHFHDRPGQRDRPPRPPRLGRRERELTTDPLQRRLHPQRPAAKINSRPAKAQQLAPSQPEHQRQHVGRVQPVIGCRIQQCSRLLGAKGSNSRRSYRGGDTSRATFRPINSSRRASSRARRRIECT
jgi:hypothetical protein